MKILFQLFKKKSSSSWKGFGTSPSLFLCYLDFLPRSIENHRICKRIQLSRCSLRIRLEWDLYLVNEMHAVFLGIPIMRLMCTFCWIALANEFRGSFTILISMYSVWFYLLSVIFRVFLSDFAHLMIFSFKIVTIF